RMSRRRGSATALKASEVVAALAIWSIYSHTRICQLLFLGTARFTGPPPRGAAGVREGQAQLAAQQWQAVDGVLIKEGRHADFRRSAVRGANCAVAGLPRAPHRGRSGREDETSLGQVIRPSCVTWLSFFRPLFGYFVGTARRIVLTSWVALHRSCWF